MYHSQVLVVDDEPANLLALEAMLSPLGCQVTRAQSGREALRHLLHGEFALVLLDLQMPTMDGMEVAALIRSRTRSQTLPIIFVTASDPAEFPVEKAYAVGAVDYLTKPLNPPVLLSKVKFFLELHAKNVQLQQMQAALHAAELKASSARADLILANATDYAFIEMSLEGKISGWSAGAERITGWTKAEVLGADVGLLYTPEDVQSDRPAIERQCALRSGAASDERWLLRKDGSRFYADGTTVAVLDDTGIARSMSKIFRDSTARMLGEIDRQRLFQQSRDLSARLNSIFQQAPAFLCTLQGPQHVFEMANERYYQLIDKTPAILGQPVRAVLPDVASQGFIDLLDDVYKTGESYVGNNITLSVRQHDGKLVERVLDFMYVALRDTHGAITGVLAHGIDNTERKQYETAARAMDERHRKLIESMDEGFCLIEMIFDPDGNPYDYRFLEVNPIFSEQTGLDPRSVGKTVRELVPDLDPSWVQRYGGVATSGVAIRFVEEAKAMGRWFDVYATRLGDSSSNTVALLFSDITARRKADEDLRHFAAELSEASRKKSEFLAVLAHELRNPLAPIRSGLEVIRLSADKPAMITKVAAMMDRQVNHMVHLIDDLLDVARITSGKVELRKQTILIADVLANAIEASMPLVTASRHTLKTSLDIDELFMHADPTRIAQVIANLITNAAKYTPEGGHINIAAKHEGDSIRITVSDNGVGIPPEALPSIFDMFSQVSRNLGRAQGGLGIGLSIVRQLVELHGGSIAARSEGIGLGTSVDIVLPLADPLEVSAPVALSSDPAKARPARRFKILVADDNVDAAEVLASLLEFRGHDVVVVHNGIAALDAARSLRPELIFLDIGMPGMTGHEVARAVRDIDALKGIRLIALTGWGAQEDRHRTREAGFDHHLTKPADLSAIDEILCLSALPP